MCITHPVGDCRRGPVYLLLAAAAAHAPFVRYGVRSSQYVMSGTSFFAITVEVNKRIAKVLQKKPMVCVGFSGPAVPSNGFVNYDEGFGFLSDGQRAHAGEYAPFGQTFGHGDTIVAEVRCDERVIRFFKNTEPLGTAFTFAEDILHQGLYPTVSLRNASVKLEMRGERLSTFSETLKNEGMDPRVICKVVPKLMNHMVVKLMNGALHESLKVWANAPQACS